MKPCSSCPFRRDAVLGLWAPAHYLLTAYLGSVREFVDIRDVDRSMGCHKFGPTVNPEYKGPVPHCAGWLRSGDSLARRIGVALGRIELDQIEPDPDVMPPEELARVNGLDMQRLPPLSYDRSDARYPTPSAWADAVRTLRDALDADPEHAWSYVLPGSPLARGVSSRQITKALGRRAMKRGHTCETS